MTVEAVTAILQSFGKLGLIVHITEHDARIDTVTTGDPLHVQANAYRVLAQACVQTPACISYSVNHCTKPGFLPINGPSRTSNTPVRTHCHSMPHEPKPAFWVIVDVLNGT